MTEEWKDVVGFENTYEISNLGKVRSKDRIIKYSDGRIIHRKSFIKKPTYTQGGYPRIGLQVNGKLVMKFVHRLVAEAFIPNPNNYPIINHKDEDKNNFQASNLEWCNYSYNTSYSNKGINRRSNSKGCNSKIILKLTLEGIEVGRYNGASGACRKNKYNRGRLDNILYGNGSKIYDNHIWVLV